MSSNLLQVVSDWPLLYKAVLVAVGFPIVAVALNVLRQLVGVLDLRVGRV